MTSPIQVIYAPGTWGNCLRWMLDRFYNGTNFADIDSPWDENGRAHGFKEQDFNVKFRRGHQQVGRHDSPDPDTDKIVISFDTMDQVFVERCGYYRNPGWDTEQDRYKMLISLADPTFVKECFNGATHSKSVAKELVKIKFYDIDLHEWYNAIEKMKQVKENYNFDLSSFFGEQTLANELASISERFKLDLDISDSVIHNVVSKIQNSFVVQTKDRHKTILEAIKNKKNVRCADIDILEQAYIEMTLEKTHGIIFPYGTNWFTDTAQINDYIITYPKYFKQMDKKLPWHKRDNLTNRGNVI